MGTTAHTLLAVFSVFGHAGVLLLQGTTLSVAINASNRALLTVMMSNNFVELKGAVFKKFDKINLFQVWIERSFCLQLQATKLKLSEKILKKFSFVIYCSSNFYIFEFLDIV
jgi:hypothetical protein